MGGYAPAQHSLLSLPSFTCEDCFRRATSQRSLNLETTDVHEGTTSSRKSHGGGGCCLILVSLPLALQPALHTHNSASVHHAGFTLNAPSWTPSLPPSGCLWVCVGTLVATLHLPASSPCPPQSVGCVAIPHATLRTPATLAAFWTPPEKAAPHRRKNSRDRLAKKVGREGGRGSGMAMTCHMHLSDDCLCMPALGQGR